MKSNVTLKEIAIKTGFSISTVSKALNNSYEISNVTKKNINDVAKSLCYKPNFFAKNLKKRKNYIIGVIVPNFKDDFIYNFINAIIEETSSKEHRVMLYQTCNSLQRESKYIKLLSDDLIDGLIVYTHNTLITDYTKQLKGTLFTIVRKKDNRNESGLLKANQIEGLTLGKKVINDLIFRIKSKTS